MIRLSFSDSADILHIKSVDKQEELAFLSEELTIVPRVYTDNGWKELPKLSYMFGDKAIAGGLWSDLLTHYSNLVSIDNMQQVVRAEYANKSEQLKLLVDKLIPPAYDRRPYQFDAPIKSIVFRKSSHVLGTSAGKTLCAYLSVQLQKILGISKKLLVLVPDNFLANQMYNEFVNDFLPHTTHKLTIFKMHTGAYNDAAITIDNADVVISTYDAMHSYVIKAMKAHVIKEIPDVNHEHLKDGRFVQFYFAKLNRPLPEALQFDSILVDEAHKVKIETLKLIFRHFTHVHNRYGFSGSIKSYVKDYDRMTLQAYVGAVTHEVSVKYLIDNGWATKVYVQPIVMHAHGEINSKFEQTLLSKARPDKIDATPEQIAANTQLLIENKSLCQLRERQFIAQSKDYAKQIAQMVNNFEDNANAVVFEEGVTHQLHTLAEAFAEHCPNYQVHIIHGAISDEERVRIVELMRKEPTGHCLLASVSTMGTGKSIHTLKYMLLVNVGKSFYQTLQVIGRLLRQHKNKEFAIIFDIVLKFRLNINRLKQYPGGVGYCKSNYVVRHQAMRIIEYNNEEHAIKPTNKINIEFNE